MLTIRSVSKQDDEGVKGMILGILETEFPPEERDYLKEGIENVSEIYKTKNDETFLVACDQDQIVGTVGIKKEDDREALLRRLFVKPEYRRQKIGSQLIQKAIEFCRASGYREIIFKTTSRMQQAIKLLEANGFSRRATIALGPLNLFKFTIHLANNGKNRVRNQKKAKRR